MLFLGLLAIFVAAAAGIAFCAITALRCAGMALNPNRPGGQRALFGALAFVAVLGIFASSFGGFFGISALNYQAQLSARGSAP